MIRILVTILLFFLSSNLTIAQCGGSDILMNRLGKLIGDDDDNWDWLLIDNKIVLSYDGNFTTNTIKGPRDVNPKERKKPTANSISFELIMADGWSDSTYLLTKSRNASALEILKKEYISHFDSVGWPIRHSVTIFEDHPMGYLEHFSLKSEEVYSSIVRLPDFRIGECGVWIDSSLDFSIWYIVQANVREEIERMIVQIVSLDSYIGNSLDGDENY